MGLFDQIAGMIGGAEQLQHLASGNANLHDPQSQDSQNLQQVVSNAPEPVVQQAFSQAAQQVDPQQYAEHVTPGAGGTNPLGALSQGALSSVAGALLNNVTGGQGGGAGQLGQLTQLIPGLQTTNPQQMGPQEVAMLASYLQQHNPQAFGQAAAQIGQQQPDLLHSLLGNKALMIGAAVLGAKLLQERAQARSR
jgi:hypothetical protein